MTDDRATAISVIQAPISVIFEVLADPANHTAIDGTGWVRASLDSHPLSAAGQTFRMTMYHPNHPDGNYEMVNQVEVFDVPSAIAWKPGYDQGDGTLGIGGWIWRYDLTPLGPTESEVRLSYDWSAVPEDVRQRQVKWPPFSPDHLSNSLANLAQLVAG